MKIPEIELNEFNRNEYSVFDEIFKGNKIGFIIRDFFSETHIESIKDCFYSYSQPKFEPADHYRALPRPFAGILGQEQLTNGYKEEVEYLNQNSAIQKLSDLFRKNFEQLGNTQIEFSRTDQNYSLSKNWFSIRELSVNGGTFEIHCGNFFINWNKDFFRHHKMQGLSDNHLSFLGMIQKPESVIDIKIYDAHWDNIKERIDLKTLKDKQSRNLNIDELESYDISLNAGDLLLFDESNYWHMVPEFSGSTTRLTFGGFISKFKNADKVLFWA